MRDYATTRVITWLTEAKAGDNCEGCSFACTKRRTLKINVEGEADASARVNP
jgi:hypothetical protein